MGVTDNIRRFIERINTYLGRAGCTHVLEFVLDFLDNTCTGPVTRSSAWGGGLLQLVGQSILRD